MRIKLTRVGLLVYLANHYTTRGAPAFIVEDPLLELWESEVHLLFYYSYVHRLGILGPFIVTSTSLTDLFVNIFSKVGIVDMIKPCAKEKKNLRNYTKNINVQWTQSHNLLE